MQANEIDRLNRLETALETNTQAIEQLGQQVSALVTSVDELKPLSEQVSALVTSVGELRDDLKGWTTWLRSATTIILFSVALTLIGLVLPIAIGLWRQSLV